MAGSFNNFLESEVLEHLFGSSAFTPTTVFWVALYTASPGEAGSSTAEVNGVTFAVGRQQLSYYTQQNHNAADTRSDRAT